MHSRVLRQCLSVLMWSLTTLIVYHQNSLSYSEKVLPQGSVSEEHRKGELFRPPGRNGWARASMAPEVFLVSSPGALMWPEGRCEGGNQTVALFSLADCWCLNPDVPCFTTIYLLEGLMGQCDESHQVCEAPHTISNSNRVIKPPCKTTSCTL